MIVAVCKEKEYKAGDYIFRQGDFGEYLYVIVEGNIVLERWKALGARKGTAVIGILGKGGAMGCWSTLLGESCNHMASAACRKPAKVVAIQGSDLRDMMLSSREFGFWGIRKSLLFTSRQDTRGIWCF
jgi:CRP-like cAMP-binding protein